ncbi:hypothetical protein AHMF7605_07625 [Adhaeribacter arboris]|uniref:Sortilin N-terminal domain-containing protein n=1 Tax=Adhaeribacter arboris TaxID=2072846 RepID=A0A2T2YD43_9BACT|nr:hypothetical protein [Adhaeribacter arboris]PSR53406.1 hypothetical protein AHMF7605_07625 [Adhaeribacter arboris]
MKNLRFKLLYYLPFFLLLLSCTDSEIENPAKKSITFKPIGLSNRIVYELTVQDNKLYAATDNGVFVKSLSASSNWQELGLQGQMVKTILFIPDGTCLVSVSNPAKEEHQLYKAENNTFNFQQVNTNFGGTEPEPINNMAFNPATNEILGVGYNVVAKSTDKGTTWTPIYGDWHYLASGLDFVQLNQKNGDIWAGGQNGIEGFNLVQFSKASNTWQNWTNLIESPSTAKDIAFDKNNAKRLIIGGEDGIIKTEDNGTTWTTIKHEPHSARFYFGVDFDLDNSNKIYAASWLKNFSDPQPLLLYISENAGTTWKEYKYKDDSLFGGVWDMVQVKEGEKTKLYLGLYKGGVFEVTIDS